MKFQSEEVSEKDFLDTEMVKKITNILLQINTLSQPTLCDCIRNRPHLEYVWAIVGTCLEYVLGRFGHMFGIHFGICLHMVGIDFGI